MKVKWNKTEDNFPKENKPVWIITDQNHLNLAWYLEGKKAGFWPYGVTAYDINLPHFVDKFGECSVEFWAYAELPEIE